MVVTTHPWRYFASADEACEWLPFDTPDDSPDRLELAFKQPDVLREWADWRAAACR